MWDFMQKLIIPNHQTNDPLVMSMYVEFNAEMKT